MPEGVLRILSVAVLVLLYLFFVRALRAMWVVSHPPETEPRARRPRQRSDEDAPARAPSLVVLAPPERRGERFTLGAENTLGRAPGCEISIDDGYVSQLHARVFSSGGRYLVEDLGSTNGTRVNGEAVGPPVPISRGDRLRVGSFELEMDG